MEPSVAAAAAAIGALTRGSGLEAIIASLGEAVVVLDADQHVVHVDPAAFEVVGIPTEDVLGRGADLLRWQIVDTDGVPMTGDERPGVEAIRTGRPAWDKLVGLRLAGGSLRWMCVSTVPLLGPDGSVVGAVIGLSDGAEPVVELRRRRHSERLLEEAQRLAGVGSWEWDFPAATLTASSGLRRIIGVPDDEVVDVDRLMDVIHPDDRDRAVTAASRALQGGDAFTVNHRIVLPDGRVRHLRTWGEMQLAPDGSPVRVWGIAQDVTPHRLEQERFLVLARTDPLTGVANRSGVDAEWRRLTADRRADPIAVVLLDIDRFKALNDDLGHPVGDQVLVEVAGRLRRAARFEDVVGRLGGDEFIVLMPGASADDLQSLAERLQAGVGSEPVPTARGEVPVQVTAGVCRSHPGSGLAAAMEAADRALLRAKQQGGGSTAIESC